MTAAVAAAHVAATHMTTTEAVYPVSIPPWQ